LKVAAVTGASRGLGYAIQKELVRLGYKVISMSRTDPGDEQHVFYALDLADQASILEAASQVEKNWGEGIDLLVNCAGFGISGPFEETSLRDIRKQFDVNVFGAWELTRQLIPLLEKKRGRILFVSSVAATIPIPFQSFYSVSKAAITHMSLCLDNELIPLGMRSLCVELGDISTTFTDHRCLTVAEEDPIYGNRAINSIRKMENDERCGSDVEPLARRIVKLTTQKRTPKPVQGFGPGYRTLLFLAKILPVRLMNGILYKLYAKS